jgi:hypothetical protein
MKLEDLRKNQIIKSKIIDRLLYIVWGVENKATWNRHENAGNFDGAYLIALAKDKSDYNYKIRKYPTSLSWVKKSTLEEAPWEEASPKELFDSIF